MYFKRDLEDKIVKYMDRDEIIAVFGPRQVGKTTLLKHIYNPLKDSAIFLTFEDVELKILFEEDLKSFIKLYIEPYKYIFIDEFQYAREGGKQLKYIFDTLRKKIFISGSSVMELSVNVIRYLAGRIFVFNLYSFSFEEFLRVKDDNLFNLYKTFDKNISKSVSKKIYSFFDEYVVYGGYPRVVLSDGNEEKIEILKNLLSIYLLRDIKETAGIVDENKMYKLLKALSLQIGSIVTYNELANIVGVNTVKLKEYLDIFEKVFMIKMLTPFYTNKRIEIVKNPKVYMYDLGLRNIVLKNFSKLEERVDKGAILENFVFRELCERDIKYYRTKNGAEVDFIVDEQTPIEVKSHINSLKVSRSYHHFIEKYKPKEGYILNFDQIGSTKIDNTKINFIPHYLIKQSLIHKS